MFLKELYTRPSSGLALWTSRSSKKPLRKLLKSTQDQPEITTVDVWKEHTARIISLSSIVLSASDTASPTLTPVFFSSSAAARRRGFSLILDVSCKARIFFSHQLPKHINDILRTRARSYAALAFFIASES